MTKTWVAGVFSYSDGKLYWLYSPKYDIPAGTEAGSLRDDGYWEIGCNGISYLRHRLIYALHTGEWPSLIDHKDRDRENDRFENLRPYTKSLNGHNSDKSWGTVPHRGVSFDNRNQKFAAYCKINYKRKFLGYFKSAEEAARVYEDYRKEVVGNDQDMGLC